MLSHVQHAPAGGGQRLPEHAQLLNAAYSSLSWYHRLLVSLPRVEYAQQLLHLLHSDWTCVIATLG